MPDIPLDLVVRGGTLVTAEGRQVADLGIKGETIAQIGGAMTGRCEIDARGALVLPGGVDPHVHLHVEDVDPDDAMWADDYTSGSQAALAGGITTVGNMAFTLPWESLQDRVVAETAAIAREAIADVFFHLAVTCPTAETAGQVPACVAAGHSGVKFFMCMPSFEPSARHYAAIMKATAEAGGVTLIHCEDLPIIECCTAMLAHQHRTTLRAYAESRPAAAENIATERAIEMCRATGCPTYIVHLSSAHALDLCRAARAQGLPVFVETRPLYLFLTAERYHDSDGALYTAQPPLRGSADIEALWQGLVDGSIDTIGSDHAPWTRAHKIDPAQTVQTARPGVAELDTMLPLLFTEGVGKQRISVERFVALTATNPARIFGLYPRKGTIAVGSDADLAVWETNRRRLISNDQLFSRAGHSVYAGREVTAWPRTTIRRGQIVFDDGQVLAAAGSGRAVNSLRAR
ncbi:MAG TPA: amidohydrolase family protein [Polyangia bacterium]